MKENIAESLLIAESTVNSTKTFAIITYGNYLFKGGITELRVIIYRSCSVV